MMLHSWVAVVLGNAVIAAALAAGVVLLSRVLARRWHRPALIHALWVVVLLKLVTPPVVSIPVPLDLPDLVGSNTPAPADALPVRTTTETASAPRAAVPAGGAHMDRLALEPPETIVIEQRSDTAEAMGLPEVDPDDLLAPWDRDETSLTDAADALGDPAAAVGPDTPAVASLPDEISGSAPRSEMPAVETSSAKPAWLTWRTLWLVGLAAWTVGAVVVLLRSVRQIVRFERSLRRAEPAEGAIAECVRRLARQIGLTRPPSVWLLPGAVSPMLWGVGRRPRLLFPRELLGRLDHDSAETLILHELAHMRRGDHWVRLLELICQCVYWWHPVVWWGGKQLRIVEEECCDAWVVEQCRGGRVYARALVAAVDFLSEHPCAMPPAASGIGNLEFLKRRLTMIMHGGVSARLAGLPKLLLLTAAVVCLSVLPKVVEQTVAAETDADTPAQAEKAQETEETPTEPAASSADEAPADAAANPAPAADAPS
jgi:beta-lactamase regulating signal transducer with metallopeptidase domain